MHFCGVCFPVPRWIYAQDRVAAPDSCRGFITRRGVFLHPAGPEDGDGGCSDADGLKMLVNVKVHVISRVAVCLFCVKDV